jgi:hypothetical protein
MLEVEKVEIVEHVNKMVELYIDHKMVVDNNLSYYMVEVEDEIYY